MSDFVASGQPVKYIDLPRRMVVKCPDLMVAIESVLRSGQLIGGREVERFESDFAELCGVEHAVGVANGTDALHLTLRALGIGPGDEVITAPNTFLATAGAIVAAGARPVFADVGSDLNLDPAREADAISERTRAIIPVHLTGRIADLDTLNDIANHHDLIVVEDAAQAIGADYRGDWRIAMCATSGDTTRASTRSRLLF